MEEVITVITGTSKGIGEYLAKYYLSKGHIVYGCSRTMPKWVDENVKNYFHYLLDVSDEKAVKKMFIDIRKKHGHLENLINNAAMASMNHVLLFPLMKVEELLNTNIIGTFLFCREASKLMKKNKYGRIINFTSGAVRLKIEGESIYAASKAGIESFTQIIAKELGEFGITANIVCPGPVKTDLIAGVDPQKIEKNFLGQQSVKRYCTFEDIVNVIDFYLKPESDFISGQALYLGGI